MEKHCLKRPPNLARVCVSLFLVAAVVLSGCGGKATPTPKPATAPSPTPRAAQTAVPTTPPAASEGAIPIPSGGSVVVPEGALPKDAKVSITTTGMPALPDDVKPVGEAIAVTASAQPSQPVTLRLPIPAGVADASRLAVIRVESDGMTTFLMTEVEGQELVAATPGFSTFSIGELIEGEKVTLVGPNDLVPGEQGQYYPRAEPMLIAQDAVWTAARGATLEYQSATAAMVRASAGFHWGDLSFQFVDLAKGRRWYGLRSIRILTEAEAYATRPFRVRVSALTPVTYGGEEVRITAALHGSFKPPITWTWDFGDGETGGPTTTGEGTSSLELPLKRYPAQEKAKAFSIGVNARDADNREVSGTLMLLVNARPFQVAIDGPERLSWNDPAASSAYTASVSGGEAPYRYSWLLSPGGERRDVSDFASLEKSATSTELFIFNEPGAYTLEVTATDAQKKTATAILPIRIEGGEALSTHILNLPATAKPKENITINIQVRGGVLAVSGKKAGYTLRIDWGDGSQAVVEKNVGMTRTSYQGTVVPASHSYAETKTYTVLVEVFDPTGSSARDSRQITITDAAPTASPTAPKTNTPPVAEDISTSTKSGTPVQITLKGTDADGDKLTYNFARPSNGSLTGAAPFLTYTPKAGFSGTDTFTYKVRDGKVDSAEATVSILVQGLSWVLDGAPLINATDPKLPLEYHGGVNDPLYFGEARFAGKFTIYRLSETLIAMDDREVDRGKEFWNVTYESRFDAPPAELTPGQVVTLTVKISASGSVTEGMPPTIRFQYGADKAHASIIKPSQPVGYNPWFTSNPGVDSGTWTLTVPNGKLGDTFQVWAGWWNCAVCNVTWTYKAQ